MAEDSGAFKTNQRNSARIGHFVITAIAAAKMPHDSKNAVHRPNAAYGAFSSEVDTGSREENASKQKG
jgi:hypothetical protein